MTEVDALGAWIPPEEKGIKDEELWSLDATLTDYILPRIKKFREMSRHGWPADLIGTDEERDEAESDPKKWEVYEARNMAKWEEHFAVYRVGVFIDEQKRIV